MLAGAVDFVLDLLHEVLTEVGGSKAIFENRQDRLIAQLTGEDVGSGLSG